MMIGDMFKEKREAIGLTQVQVAQRLYVSQSLIGQVEAGMKMPTVAMVRAAAELFGCSTDELIFGRSGAAS